MKKVGLFWPGDYRDKPNEWARPQITEATRQLEHAARDAARLGVGVAVAVEALYDAADDDSATGGPDPIRQLWPVVYVVNRSGALRVPDRDLAAVAGAVIESRAVARREA